jgi:glycosyltransferase involved in cell wall biosynthesis
VTCVAKQHGTLVSVIIPCYNAEIWIAEAIDSCLSQTYPHIEVIVVDDGSTDGSLALAESYSKEIRIETGPNQGGNHARNRGFRKSRGEYIQFLDADDYLLPEKIQRQVGFLEEFGADVVYGDWRHRFHEPDGSSHLGEVQISGEQVDVLESLLAGWWVAPVALLWRRRVVVESGGWDEALTAAQDRDFFTMVALSGSDIRYQSGCHSVYRRYGNVTVSTSNTARWLENSQQVLEKAERKLQATSQLLMPYRRALATSYFRLARNYYDVERSRYDQLLDRALELCPGFQPAESPLYDAAYRLFGFRMADRLASYKRRLSSRALNSGGQDAY